MLVSVVSADSELLLDLLNTTPIVAGAPIDEWTDTVAVRNWFDQRGFEVSDTAIPELRRVRGTLQDVVRRVQPPDNLAEYLDGVTRTPRLDDGVLRWDLSSTTTPLIVVDLVIEWARLNETMPGRLRPCGNDECRRFLLDRTRAGTARWCSMATCGNRIKARRHSARTAGSRGHR